MRVVSKFHDRAHEQPAFHPGTAFFGTFGHAANYLQYEIATVVSRCCA